MSGRCQHAKGCGCRHVKKCATGANGVRPAKVGARHCADGWSVGLGGGKASCRHDRDGGLHAKGIVGCARASHHTHAPKAMLGALGKPEALLVAPGPAATMVGVVTTPKATPVALGKAVVPLGRGACPVVTAVPKDVATFTSKAVPMAPMEYSLLRPGLAVVLMVGPWGGRKVRPAAVAPGMVVCQGLPGYAGACCHANWGGHCAKGSTGGAGEGSHVDGVGSISQRCA